MCGIFGYIGKKNDASRRTLAGLKSLEYRGYDSWGIAVVDQKKRNGSISVKKRVGKIGDAHVNELPKSTVALGHTRWATHGGVTLRNAHPHLDCTGAYAVVHNGIIENYSSLAKKLYTKRHKIISDTDTEIAVHAIEERVIKQSFEDAVRETFNSFEGLNGLIALDGKNKTIIAVRKGSPLVIGESADGYYVASDPSAIIPFTKYIYFLEDNELALVTAEHVDILDVVTGNKKIFKPSEFTSTISDVTKGSYPHFMLKEIHEQPDIIYRIARSSQKQAQLFASLIKDSYGTYMVGCGTAAYACMAGSYLFSRIAGRHINWGIGSEFGFKLDFLTSKSLVIALSQSGETMDTLEAVKRAKIKKATLASLVNVEGSTLYRLSDMPFLLGAGTEKGVASSKAFTAMIAHLILAAYATAGDIQRGALILNKASSSIKSLLGKSSIAKVKRLATNICKQKHIYIVGRGLSYPTSMESALKIKELSYIHAEGFAAGELKHGVIALIEKGTPCIVFAPNDDTYATDIAGAMEMKARGGYIIGVSHKPNEIFDYYFHVADAEEATIIPNVVFAQLLSYYTTIELGYDPDKPRNLAKSVTVK